MSFPACVPDFLFDAFKTAEFQSRSAPGFFGTHPCRQIVRDLSFQMEAQFFVESAFRTGLVEETPEPTHCSDSYSTVRRIRATASVIRSQLRTSSSNCLRPFLVSAYNLASLPVS